MLRHVGRPPIPAARLHSDDIGSRRGGVRAKTVSYGDLDRGIGVIVTIEIEVTGGFERRLRG